MSAAVLRFEVGSLQCVVDFFFVVFGDVEDEWPQASVVVHAVLFPDVGSADGYNDACAGFADFDG